MVSSFPSDVPPESPLPASSFSHIISPKQPNLSYLRHRPPLWNGLPSLYQFENFVNTYLCGLFILTRGRVKRQNSRSSGFWAIKVSTANSTYLVDLTGYDDQMEWLKRWSCYLKIAFERTNNLQTHAPSSAPLPPPPNMFSVTLDVL